MFDAYIICTTPRSGSTLLCSLLSATKCAGHPNSFYRRPSIGAWAKGWGVVPEASTSPTEFNRAYMSAALQEGRGSTPMFGMRLMRENIPDLCDSLHHVYPQATDDIVRINRAFGRTCFIHLIRPDPIAKAVSLVLATQSGLWHRAHDGSELERLSPPKDPIYDREAIQQAVDDYVRFDQGWTDWFTAQSIEPYRSDYDDLSREPQDTLKQLLQHLGLNPNAAQGVTPGVSKLAGPVNKDWIARFRRDTGLDA